MSNNNKQANSISFLKHFNELKSQSAKEHDGFLENYYKNKINCVKSDLNRTLAESCVNAVKTNEETKDNNMNSIMLLGSSVSNYLTSSISKIFKNNAQNASGIDTLEKSTTFPITSEERASSKEEEDDDDGSVGNVSTLDADSFSNQEDIDESPCLVKSNRIDKIGASFIDEQLNRKASNSIKIKKRDNSSEDFIFLPDDRNIERFSVMSYEVLSKSEGINTDYTVHIKEFTHSTIENQNFKCANCDRKIKNAKLRCHYFGRLYCNNCHQSAKYYIPARLINNMDTKKYPVSENARYMLESVFRKPIFDIIYDNADLYSKSSLLNECKKMRSELEHIRWFLQTCKNNNAKNQFIMYLWPDDYLYETIHLYSLFDLTNIKDTFNKIKSARDYGIGHILKDCELCLQKGFICEICKSDQNIYPFQIENTTQCAECGSLVHKTCRQGTEECLKCQRMNKRH